MFLFQLTNPLTFSLWSNTNVSENGGKTNTALPAEAKPTKPKEEKKTDFLLQKWQISRIYLNTSNTAYADHWTTPPPTTKMSKVRYILWAK